MTKRWRLRKRIEALQAGLDAIQSELDRGAPDR